MIIRKDRYVKGTHNVISDLSGQKYKRSDCRLTWDNLLVGIDEWEEKHPQLIIRAHEDRTAVLNQTRTQDRTETLDLASFDPTGKV